MIGCDWHISSSYQVSENWNAKQSSSGGLVESNIVYEMSSFNISYKLLSIECQLFTLFDWLKIYISPNWLFKSQDSSLIGKENESSKFYLEMYLLQKFPPPI